MNAQEFLLQFAKAQEKAGKRGGPVQVIICTINLEDYFDIVKVGHDAGTIVIDVDINKSIT